jgi:hypothetical protein
VNVYEGRLSRVSRGRIAVRPRGSLSGAPALHEMAARLNYGLEFPHHLVASLAGAES